MDNTNCLCEQRFLIWSFEHDAWWRSMESGYTEKVVEAGEYRYKHALQIVTDANRYVPAGQMPNEAMVLIYNTHNI